MCEPSTIIMGVGLVLGAYGQQQQGKYQAQVADNNAFVSSVMAEDARERGRREEGEHRLRVAQEKSKQRAAIAAGGREIDGSAADLLADTAMIGELDAMTIRSNAEREAYGHEVQGGNFRTQGQLSSMRGNYGAASTLLAGGARVHDRWKTYS